jgi:hypothetical protein
VRWHLDERRGCAERIDTLMSTLVSSNDASPSCSPD